MRSLVRRSWGRIALVLLGASGVAAGCGSGEGKRAERNEPTEGGDGGMPSGAGTSGTKTAGSAGTAGKSDMPMTGGAGSSSTPMGGEGGVAIVEPTEGGAAGAAGASEMPMGSLDVVPRYPNNGAFWNDYVKADGTNRFDAADVACNGATDGPTYEACIHAGEVRAALVPGRSDCASGLGAVDSLGVFDWTCVVDDGKAWVVSSGLKAGKHLADLLDFQAGAWRTLTLTAADDNGPVAASQPAVWWSNTVRKLTGVTTSATAHDVLITTTGSTGNITAHGDKIAYVTDPAATHPGQVSLRGNFLWVEPRLTSAFVVDLCGFVVVRGASITGALGSGFQFLGCRASVVEDVTATGNASQGAASANAAIRGTGLRVARVTTNAGAGYSARGIFIGNDSFAVTSGTFEDLSDTGSGNGIWVTKTSNSSFKRLTSIGAVGGTSSDGAISTGANVTSSSFEDLSVNNAAQDAIYLYSTNSTYRRLRVSGAGASGLTLRNAGGNRVEDVRLADLNRTTTSAAINLPCYWNVLQNISVFGVSDGLIIGSDTQNVRLANLYVSGGDRLVNLGTNSSGGGIVLQNVTAVNSGYRPGVVGSAGTGVFINSSANKFIGNLLALNNERGMFVSSALVAPAPRVRNFVGLGSSAEALGIADGSRTTFDGAVRLGKDPAGLACNVVPGAIGMTETCTNEAPSTATITLDRPDNATVVGPVTSDSANADDAAGLASYTSTLDNMNFESNARAWGTTGAGAWPSVDQQGRCDLGDTCQIYDLSLRSTDTVARNLATLPGGDDVISMTDKVSSGNPASQSDCDTHSPGSVFVAGAPNICRSTFLRDAVELLFDGSGDDDNLCESNETCLFSPNAGAYQGHGNLVSAGSFVDGQITGVTLLKYETNGR